MSTRARLLVAGLSTGLVFYIALGSVLGRVMGDTTYGQLTVFNEVVRMVIDSYVEPIDLDRTMDGAYLGLTEALDGDSNYLDAAQYQALSRRQDSGDVGLVLSRRHGFLMVVGTRPGSPARRAGVRTGDLIKTIDGRHTRGVAPPAAEQLLAGEPGGRVHLEIHRAGAELIEVDLVRERLAEASPSVERLPDGTARAWGSNYHGQCFVPVPPAGRSYVHVATPGTRGRWRRSGRSCPRAARPPSPGRRRSPPGTGRMRSRR